MEARLKEIENESSEFQKRLTGITELMQSQLTWIGANVAFSNNMLQNTTGELNMEMALLNFSSRVAEILNTAVETIVEKRK